MRPTIKRASALSAIAAGIILSGAKSSCNSTPPANCNPDDCCRTYCLGPENILANAPVGPITCDGDIAVTLSGFYWRASQDGMEYAIKNATIGTDSQTGNADLNNLIDANYLTPRADWEFGFKLGGSYTSACDGWDFGILWTSFRDGMHSHVEAEFEDNQTLLPLWSGFQFPNAGQAPILFASDIETFWKLNLNWIDLDLGREMWTSKYVTIRPHIGLRIAYIDQRFEIMHKGGSWNDPGLGFNFNDWVDLKNNYRGVGIRSGLDTLWNVGCGWGIYGDFAASIIYGKFSLSHDETLRDAASPFGKRKIIETDYNFKASRSILDLGLGVQWASLMCDNKYGLTIQLGFEEHLFLHQNQMWRIHRLGGTSGSSIINPTGENIYSQRRGTLSTIGWTLTGNFAF